MDDATQLLGSLSRLVFAESTLGIIGTSLGVGQQRLAVADFSLHLVHKNGIAAGVAVGDGEQRVLSFYPRCGLVVTALMD